MKLNSKKIKECAEWVEVNGLVDYGGATIRDFCKSVGISERTYGYWKNIAEFAEAIKKAKEIFAENLEKDIVLSLAKSAKGYTFTKKKTEYKNNKEGKPQIAKQTIEDINVAPNVGAAIFLLTNLAPERWKNKISNEVEAKVEATNDNYNYMDLPEDLLFEIADKIQEEQHKKVMENKPNN